MVVIAMKYNNISVWIYPGRFFPLRHSRMHQIETLSSVCQVNINMNSWGQGGNLSFYFPLCYASAFDCFVYLVLGLLFCLFVDVWILMNRHSGMNKISGDSTEQWLRVLVCRLFRSHFKSFHLWKISLFYSNHMPIVSLSLISGSVYHVFDNSLCPYFLLHLVPLLDLFLPCPVQSLLTQKGIEKVKFWIT